MQFGSVQFFKNLFISVLVLMIIIPTSIAMYFGILLNQSQIGLELSSIGETNPCISVTSFSEKFEELKPSNLDIHVYPHFNDAAENPDYVHLFPELYVPHPINDKVSIPKTIFLTFDDGPSARTTEILDILKKTNVKATFFVVGNNLKTEENRNILKRTLSEGHNIGIHTTSHEYSTIYSSIEAFLEDFNETYELIYEITGIKSEIFRFPGGSINAYNGGIYQELIAEMIRRGFTYYDWNIFAGDATISTPSVDKICDNMINHSLKVNRAIILMHDSADKYNTVKSIQIIIDALNKEGFTFLPISANVKPIIFGYK